MKLIILLVVTVSMVLVGNVLFLCRMWDRIDAVKVPVHISLDTVKYKILKEDSLTLEGMKIKRIYYLQK